MAVFGKGPKSISAPKFKAQPSAGLRTFAKTAPGAEPNRKLLLDQPHYCRAARRMLRHLIPRSRLRPEPAGWDRHNHCRARSPEDWWETKSRRCECTGQ